MQVHMVISERDGSQVRDLADLNISGVAELSAAGGIAAAAAVA